MKVYVCTWCGWVGTENELWSSVSKLLCGGGTHHPGTQELTKDNFDCLTTVANRERARQLLDSVAA